MAYDEKLAARIRHAFRGRPDAMERKMFGGLAFLLGGRMCCGIVGTDLMVRVGGDEFQDVMRQRHVRPIDFTGKPLRGFVYVSPPGFPDSASVARVASASVCLHAGYQVTSFVKTVTVDVTTRQRADDALEWARENWQGCVSRILWRKQNGVTSC